MPTDPDYPFIKEQLETGQVIPFLGSAASLVVDSPDSGGLPVPPSASDLARALAINTDLPEGEPIELATVAQYLKGVGGSGPLYKKLRAIFNRDYTATSLHKYLAQVASQVPLLVVTTNYDDILETAFGEVEHDVVTHICDRKLGDRVFWKKHRLVEGEWVDSEPEKVIPNKLNIDLNKTSAIYKMHGAVDKQSSSRDQYVIAEDDYIDFLTRMTRNKAIPAVFSEIFKSRHFLFLGYGLKDWNLRVVLNRIQDNIRGTSEFSSWAIQYRPSLLEYRFWIKRDVEVFDVDLKDFVRNLKSAGPRG